MLHDEAAPPLPHPPLGAAVVHRVQELVAPHAQQAHAVGGGEVGDGVVRALVPDCLVDLRKVRVGWGWVLAVGESWSLAGGVGLGAG